jgi:hypothetical protein
MFDVRFYAMMVFADRGGFRILAETMERGDASCACHHASPLAVVSCDFVISNIAQGPPYVRDCLSGSFSTNGRAMESLASR